MPVKSFEHNGHNIDVSADQDRKGYWSWSYTIDGEHYTEMPDRPLKSETVILGEGIAAAIRHADRLSA